MNIGEKIRKICAERHISLRKLALSMGIAEQTLYRNIRRGSMETKYLEQMSDILNISISYFIEGGDIEDMTLQEPGIMLRKGSKEKDYTELLEELREVSRENRNLCKRIIEVEEELKILKTEKECPDQKSIITK